MTSTSTRLWPLVVPAWPQGRFDSDRRPSIAERRRPATQSFPAPAPREVAFGFFRSFSLHPRERDADGLAMDGELRARFVDGWGKKFQAQAVAFQHVN